MKRRGFLLSIVSGLAAGFSWPKRQMVRGRLDRWQPTGATAGSLIVGRSAMKRPGRLLERRRAAAGQTGANVPVGVVTNAGGEIWVATSRPSFPGKFSAR